MAGVEASSLGVAVHRKTIEPFLAQQALCEHRELMQRASLTLKSTISSSSTSCDGCDGVVLYLAEHKTQAAGVTPTDHEETILACLKMPLDDGNKTLRGGGEETRGELAGASNAR